MMTDNKLLLSHEQIELKIQRLSNEVAEKYYNIKELYCLGIEGQGYILAKRIVKEMQNLTQTHIVLDKINIDKQNPIGSIEVNEAVLDKIKNKDVLIIDDVLNSGKTLFYAMQLFVNIPLRSLRVLVLVNRSHQRFPISPDFVGMTLSTTYQNHIEAILNSKKESKVFLMSK